MLSKNVESNLITNKRRIYYLKMCTFSKQVVEVVIWELFFFLCDVTVILNPNYVTFLC